MLRLFRPSIIRSAPRQLRRYATEPPKPQYESPTPQQQTPAPNPHREFYRGGQGRAIAFNFLVAMATFQVLYWGWLKLESMEVKQQKQDEVNSLEGEVKHLTEKAEEKLSGMTGNGAEADKEVKKKGWFGW